MHCKNLISGISDTVLKHKDLVIASEGSLEDGDVTSGGVIGNVEDITCVRVGSREYGCFISILVHLHINADQERTRILSGGLCQTTTVLGTSSA